MKIYWSGSQIPELAGLDTASQKDMMRQAAVEGRKRLGKKFVYTRAAIVGVLGIVIALGISSFMTGFIAGALAGACIGLLIAALLQSPCIEEGRIWLREQGYPKSS